MTEYAIEIVVETVRAATESLAQNKKLALKTEVAKSMPVGLGDEQRLTQALLNLVGNTIKFTDIGEVRVRVTAANSHFAVTVTDTGPGIPEEHQARIFEQFHQVDSSSTKLGNGQTWQRVDLSDGAADPRPASQDRRMRKRIVVEHHAPEKFLPQTDGARCRAQATVLAEQVRDDRMDARRIDRCPRRCGDRRFYSLPGSRI
jgi:hypothetical protein